MLVVLFIQPKYTDIFLSSSQKHTIFNLTIILCAYRFFKIVLEKLVVNYLSNKGTL